MSLHSRYNYLVRPVHLLMGFIRRFEYEHAPVDRNNGRGLFPIKVVPQDKRLLLHQGAVRSVKSERCSRHLAASRTIAPTAGCAACQRDTCPWAVGPRWAPAPLCNSFEDRPYHVVNP